MLSMIGVWGIARHSSSMDGVIDGSNFYGWNS